MTAKCRLCPVIIDGGNIAGVIVLGEDRAIKEHVQLRTAVMQHLAQHHTAAMIALTEMALHYQSVAAMKCVESTDPEVARENDRALKLAYWTLHGRFEIQTAPRPAPIIPR